MPGLLSVDIRMKMLTQADRRKLPPLYSTWDAPVSSAAVAGAESYRGARTERVLDPGQLGLCGPLPRLVS